MTLDLRGIAAAVQSHALASGHFDHVIGHEPKSAPAGLSVSTWVQSVQPIPLRSGLAATAVRVELAQRLLYPMLSEPQDDIDPVLIAAVDTLMSAYTADFELGATDAEVDLLGAHGTPLQGEAGYYSQDGQLYRGFTITLPLIVNDLWPQEA